MEKMSIGIDVYNKVYKLFTSGDFNKFEVIGYNQNKEPIKASLWQAEIEHPSVWDMGIMVGHRIYPIWAERYADKAPDNFGDLFTGQYDIVQAITDAIIEDYFGE